MKPYLSKTSTVLLLLVTLLLVGHFTGQYNSIPIDKQVGLDAFLAKANIWFQETALLRPYSFWAWMSLLIWSAGGRLVKRAFTKKK